MAFSLTSVQTPNTLLHLISVWLLQEADTKKELDVQDLGREVLLREKGKRKCRWESFRLWCRFDTCQGGWEGRIEWEMLKTSTQL